MKNEYYISQLFEFLQQLAANNNRQWFAENKSQYIELRQLWENDIDRLIAYMSTWDSRLSHLSAKTTAYRIYRDIRFSPDKSPFKTHFGAAFSPYGKSTHRAALYLHMDNSPQSGIYGGLWCPDSSMLRKIRRAIVDNIEEFEDIVNSPDLISTFPDWCGESLKTVPKGYDRNHPLAHYIRLKDFARFAHIPRQQFLNPDWPEIIAEKFSKIAPLIQFLNYSISEE